MSKLLSSAALAAFIALSTSAPAFAAGEILITQAKALAGGVTPGDAPGFPVTLSLPGAYQFSSNILPTGGVVGIHVAQRNVTIDLNGFELHGGNTANHGITSNQDATTIRNGTITGFKFDGINITGDFLVVEDVRSISNGRDGIAASTSEQARIRSSTASNNGSYGIRCGRFCIAEDNHAIGNTLYGMFVGVSGIALNNVAADNAGGGIFTSSTLVAGNQIATNTGNGLLGGGAVIGNMIHNNSGYGINGLPVLSGYVDNRLYNNGYAIGGVEAVSVLPLHPNVCAPDGCP